MIKISSAKIANCIAIIAVILSLFLLQKSCESFEQSKDIELQTRRIEQFTSMVQTKIELENLLIEIDVHFEKTPENKVSFEKYRSEIKLIIFDIDEIIHRLKDFDKRYTIEETTKLQMLTKKVSLEAVSIREKINKIIKK